MIVPYVYRCFAQHKTRYKDWRLCNKDFLLKAPPKGYQKIQNHCRTSKLAVSSALAIAIHYVTMILLLTGIYVLSHNGRA